jgi:hypothetical protein
VRVFAAVLLYFVTGGRLEFTKVAVAERFRGRFVGVVGFVTFGSELLTAVLRRPFPGFPPWFISIHADIAAELALASLLIATHFSRDMLSAIDNCAGPGGRAVRGTRGRQNLILDSWLEA